MRAVGCKLIWVYVFATRSSNVVWVFVAMRVWVYDRIEFPSVFWVCVEIDRGMQDERLSSKEGPEKYDEE